MPDIISPQEIDKTLSLIEEKIFENDPICAFCLSNILMRISDEWDSVQMPTKRHDELILINQAILDAISLPLDNLPNPDKLEFFKGPGLCSVPP